MPRVCGSFASFCRLEYATYQRTRCISPLYKSLIFVQLTKILIDTDCQIAGLEPDVTSITVDTVRLLHALIGRLSPNSASCMTPKFLSLVLDGTIFRFGVGQFSKWELKVAFT